MSALRLPILGLMTGGSSGEHHLNFNPVDTSKTEDALRAAETACQLAIQQLPQEVQVSPALLRYPEGEGDEVTITETDMEELRPGKFLGNNIVDFYIRFLERRLPPEHRKRFYFFNSFFFWKVLQSAAPTCIDPCKVDYEQVRRWTEDVNLFEKDYVFIPILKSSHWSLIIICHLSSLTCAPDETMRFPCMFHLDPIQGQHESFEGWLRSYVLQAWMERFESLIHKDQLLALYQMKYVPAEVPQQSNSHDCGLYVLNYIEAFLVKSTSPDFNFALSEIDMHFTSPYFATEVLAKRMHIQNLILELVQVSQECTRKRTSMKNLVEELLQASQNLRVFLHSEGYSEAFKKDVQLVGRANSNGEDCQIIHTSSHEDSMDVEHQQTTLKSRGNDDPVSGLQIGLGFVEYEMKSDSLSSKQQHVECEMQSVGPIHFKGSISEAKHVSFPEDSINVQHQELSKISRLECEQLDGCEVQHIEYQGATKSFSKQLEEIPCMGLSQVPKGKYKRVKNMTPEETLVLLSCKEEGGRFCKGNGGVTQWNLISEEIERRLGSRPSADQCRLRYDTLLKAYKTYHKYCMKHGKMFSELTKEERLDLKLATTLSEEWYTSIGKICDKAESRKRMKLNSGVHNDLHPLSLHASHTPTSPTPSNRRLFEGGIAILDGVCGIGYVGLANFFALGVFSCLNEDWLSTLLNLVQEWSQRPEHWMGNFSSVGEVCRRLAILQDCEPREILSYVFRLWELEFVSVEDLDFEGRKDLVRLDLWEDKKWILKSWVYEDIIKNVLPKNPHLKTYYDSFPIDQPSLQYVKFLNLSWCDELEHLDLKEFPKLKSLVIHFCTQLKLVTGWEVATSLGSIDIRDCYSYCDFRNLQFLSSLREFTIHQWGLYNSTISSFPWHLSLFSQCTKLGRLEIWGDKSLSEITNLKSLEDLKFLEFLSLGCCTFSYIQGLSGLQNLKTLHLQGCHYLERIPELGCLKELTELNISGNRVKDVGGVVELHLLTSLDLQGCKALKWLPFLGHLKALVYLDIRNTRVKEILGKEGLINLKTLHWKIN